MPQPLVVPTIFTAVDRLSGVVQRMQRSVGGFAGKASIGVNALNNGINSLLPSFGKLAKQALTFGAGYAVFSGLRAGGDALVDFEKNVASLRVTLNHLSKGEFEPYEKQIIAVARATRVSAVDVADSFAKIAELNYDLAQTPDGLGKLATSAITLSRAARLELTPATEGLVAIMSQFELPATEAARVSNALAAGFKYGSATIDDQIESYRGFGTVAKEANVTMEQSIALTQTLAKYQLKGSEAGTALRSAIIHLQNAGAGYKSGKFSLNDALDEMRKKLASLKNDKSRDSFLNSLFGIRAVTQGRLLGRSSQLMADLSRNVTATNEVFKQAAVTTETFASKWEQLKGATVTWLVSNSNANKGLNRLKGIIVYVTNNLDKIIDRVITFGTWFLYLKGAIWATQLVLGGISIAMGVFGAVTGVANIAIAESTIAMGAYRTTTGLVTAAQWLWTSAIGATTGALTASGIFGATGLLALAAVAVYEIDKHWKSWGDSITSMLGPLGEVFNMIEQIRGGADGSGINTKLAYDVQRGGIGGYASSFGDIIAEYGKSIGRFATSPFKGVAKQFGGDFNAFGDKGKEPTLMPSPFTNNNGGGQGGNSNTKIELEIKDPGKYIDSVGISNLGKTSIPVKVTPTTGIK